MARYVVSVVGGDFKPKFAVIITGGLTERFRKIKGLKRKGSLPLPIIGNETLKPRHISSVEILTQENSKSIIGKAAWGAAGTLALGGVGLVAGVLGGGNKSTAQALVTLIDGRSFLVQGKAKPINYLLQAGYV